MTTPQTERLEEDLDANGTLCRFQQLVGIHLHLQEREQRAKANMGFGWECQP